MATMINVVKLYIDGEIDAVTTIKRNLNSDKARCKLDGWAEARQIEIAYSTATDGHSHWTLRLLEGQTKIVLDT